MTVPEARSWQLRAGTFVRHFEPAFVVGTLAVTIVVTLAVPQKFALLNFYFLPVILAGYFLGQRKAVLGGLFCLLLVGAMVIFRPDDFQMAPRLGDTAMHVVIWGAFLILAGATVGKLQEQLRAQIAHTERLNHVLRGKQDELLGINSSLEESKRAVLASLGEN